MKSPWIKSLALAGAFALPSHAIMGLGAHLAPSTLEIKSNEGVVTPTGASHSLALDLDGTSGLSGLGLKLWIDALPLVDLELTGNLQVGYYDLAVIQDGDTANPHKVSFDLDIPGLKDKPFYARTTVDAAVLYPFFKFPPAISILKVYAGGGLSYGVATQTLSAKFARKAIAKAQADHDYDPATADFSTVSNVLAKAIEDEGMISGVGFFLQAGAHAKIPIIPIAAYADVKYRFLGSNPELVDGADLNFELGVALAF